MFSIFINGLLTGLLLQIAVGPVFFFIINISMQRTIGHGFVAVAAVALADYLYITLAILGVGKLLEKNRVKRVMGFISPVVLFIFGVMMIYSAKNITGIDEQALLAPQNYLATFAAAFILTISSPLTIIFWTSLFAAKAIEKNYLKIQLAVFGLSAGLATLVFLGLCVILFSIIKTAIPVILLKSLDVIVGFILILYAVARFYRSIKLAKIAT